MTLGSRVRQCRLALHWSQAELARRLKIKQQSIDQLESGSVKSPRYIVELAETLGIPLDWLRHGQGKMRFYEVAQGKKSHGKVGTFEAPMEQSTDVPKFIAHDTFFYLNGQIYCLVPVYDARALTGPGALNVENPEPISHNVFRKDWIKSITAAAPPANLIVLRVTGDSMRDTMHDGDQILVDLTVRRWVRDGLYVIRYSTKDELMVKRLVRQPSSSLLIVRSDNKNYGSQLTLSDDEIIIEGRVIWLSSSLG